MTMDTLTKEQRSARMALVRSKNTRPELSVRGIVHAMGYRYRLHARALPGCPDLVFSGRRKVIFVHGCFWHGHEGCGRMPKSRWEFWAAKIEANRRRDRATEERLASLGWSILIVWECELRDRGAVREKIRAYLDADASAAAP